jgi:hypothetical protein
MSWHWFFRIDDGFAKAANPISAVTPDPDHLYLIVCAVDGSVRWTKWDSASGWDPLGWMPFPMRTADGSIVTAAVGADSITAVGARPRSS